MKLRKLLSQLSIILICTCFCFGCAKMEVFRAVDANDVIVDKLVVTLNKSSLDKTSNSSYQIVRDMVCNDMSAFVGYVNEWKETFRLDYNDIYLGLEKGIECNESFSDNVLSVTIEFKNWSYFGLFYGLTEFEDVVYVKAMKDVGPFIDKILKQDYDTENFGLFLYKYSMINNQGIYAQLKDFKIDGINVNYYDKYTEETNYSIEDIDLSQIFAYPDDRIYSNADDKEIVGNTTFLVWDLSDKPDGFQMSIYKLAPRTTIWYVVALVISVVIVLVMLYVLAKKYKGRVTIKITKQEAEKDE